MNREGENCEICGEFIAGWEPNYCCSGFECGCRGLPEEPPICSNECWDKFMIGDIEVYREL